MRKSKRKLKNEPMCNAKPETPVLTHSLDVGEYFTSTVYSKEKPEFLDAVRAVTEDLESH